LEINVIHSKSLSTASAFSVLLRVSLPIVSLFLLSTCALPLRGQQQPLLSLRVTGWTQSFSWTTAALVTMDGNFKPADTRDMRQQVTLSAGSAYVRVTLSGADTGTAQIGGVSICAQSSGSACAATPTRITFGGSNTVAIPAGASVVSDAVRFSTSAFTAYLVPIYYTSAYMCTSSSGYDYYDVYSTDDTLMQTPSAYTSYAQGETLTKVEVGSPAANVYQATLVQQPSGVTYKGKALTRNAGARIGVGLNQWDWSDGTLYINVGGSLSSGVVQAQESGVPNSYFGLSVNSFENVTAPISYGAARTWDANPNIAWADINSAPGEYNFSDLDKYIAQNVENGRDILYTFGRTPAWASAEPTAPGPYGPGECAPPANLQDWENYVTAIVTHAAGKIKYWELWNEPQDPNFYCGDIPTMVSMAQQAYRIIKSIDPEAMVVTPSVTGVAGPAWLSSFLSSGGASYADIISFHGYWSQTAEDINSVVISYKSLMRASGVGEKPLWDTEASWTTDWTGTPQYLTDDDAQSAFLVKYYLLQWSGGVSRFYWYSYDGGIWGGLENSGTPTAAATAYGEVAKWITGATLTSPCSANASGTWTCGFCRPDGSTAVAVWNSQATVTYTVPPHFTELWDLSGNVTSLAPGNLQVGNLPVLLVSPGAHPAASGATW
jgi:polysaccharide biosynthesis protein PslG